MQNLSVGGKLFNTIVLIGISLAGACSSNDSQSPQPLSANDASSNDARKDGTTNDAPGTTTDSAIPDSGSGNDAFSGWFVGC